MEDGTLLQRRPTESITAATAILGTAIVNLLALVLKWDSEVTLAIQAVVTAAVGFMGFFVSNRVDAARQSDG